jgi:hypothetical protein
MVRSNWHHLVKQGSRSRLSISDILMEPFSTLVNDEEASGLHNNIHMGKVGDARYVDTGGADPTRDTYLVVD